MAFVEFAPYFRDDANTEIDLLPSYEEVLLRSCLKARLPLQKRPSAPMTTAGDTPKMRTRSNSDPIREKTDSEKVKSYLQLISADKPKPLPAPTKTDQKPLSVPTKNPVKAGSSESIKSLIYVAHFVLSSSRKTRRRASVLIANNKEHLQSVHRKSTRSLPNLKFTLEKKSDQKLLENAEARAVAAAVLGTNVRRRRVSFHPESEKEVVVQTLYYDKKSKIDSSATQRRRNSYTSAFTENLFCHQIQKVESVNNSPRNSVSKTDDADNRDEMPAVVLPVPRLKRNSIPAVPPSEQTAEIVVDNMDHLDFSTFKAWQRGRRHSAEILQIEATEVRRLSNVADGSTVKPLSGAWLRRVFCCGAAHRVHPQPPHEQPTVGNANRANLPDIVIDSKVSSSPAGGEDDV